MALGKIKADTLEHSTAGSLDTQYVVNGSAKHWVRINQVSSNALGDTFNNSSFTDAGTGNTGFTRTSNFANDDYPPFMSTEVQASYTNVANSTLAGAAQLTTSYMSAYHVENGSAQDTALLTMVAFGDLA